MSRRTGVRLAQGQRGRRAHPVDRPSAGVSALLLIFFLGIFAASAAAVVDAPYVVLMPGPITDVLGDGPDGEPLIQVDGATTHETNGRLDFTTVRVVGGPGNEASYLDALRGWISGDEDVFPVEEFYPSGTTRQQVEEESTAQMVDSQQEAVAVALTELDQKVTQKIVVGQVPDDSPSKGKLVKGDRIMAVDGTEIVSGDGLRDAIRAHAPGEPVKITVLRAGNEVTQSVVTKDVQGRAAIGVFLDISFTFPYKVTIDAGDVGGPSAGLMFTLGLYDKLTPGGLAGGKNIAGTGTITADGAVGPIGGIRQKLIGAREGGARFFLAPADNCGDVVGQVPEGLTVVRVATFAEALDSVTKIGQGTTSGLPVCTG